MVIALDSEVSSLGLTPGREHCVVFLAKKITIMMPLSTQVYKWVPANFMLGVTLRCTTIPSTGE